MSIEKGLFQLIQSDATVASYVTMTGGKGLYWVLVPKGSAYPCIVLSWIGTLDTIAFSGDLGLRNGLLQIDCYSSQYYNSKDIADAVRDVLKSYKGTLPDVDSTAVAGVLQTKDWDMPYEEGAVGFVYRALLEFRVWYYDDTFIVDGNNGIIVIDGGQS
jgi:hypothetical protein